MRRAAVIPPAGSRRLRASLSGVAVNLLSLHVAPSNTHTSGSGPRPWISKPPRSAAATPLAFIRSTGSPSACPSSSRPNASTGRSASMSVATATDSTCTPTAMRTAGAACHANGKPKKLQYLSFGAYEEDFDALAAQSRRAARASRIRLSDGQGIWTRDPDGTPVQVVVAPKVSPSAKSQPPHRRRRCRAKAPRPSRSKAAPVRPRHLSHVLLFTPDVLRQTAFYTDVLGLRSVRPLGRHHRLHARRARQRPSPARIRQSRTRRATIIRAGTSPASTRSGSARNR